MAEKTQFTKRDREFIINLAKNIDSLAKRFDEFEKIHNIPKAEEKKKPHHEKSTTKRVHRNESTPTVHAEFFRTDSKEKQLQQYVFVESLESMLREICEQNGIAFLSIEIDTRDQ